VGSLREAAELLSRAHAPRDVRALLAALGFGESLPLDQGSASRLELGSDVRRARVASGRGTLRALTLEIAPEAHAREAVTRAALRAAARSPHVLWLLAGVQPARRAIVLAAPAPGPAASARVSALVVEAARVLDSDAETLAAMIAAAGATDVLVHHRWRELLGREALTRRFYRDLEAAVGEMAATAVGNAPETARREIALLHASRLLFLAFLEAKGWLDGDREFLRHAFDARCTDGAAVHRRLLEPLFFGTLNTPMRRRAPAARALGRIPFLNGGLFARTVAERRWRSLLLTDAAIGRLICDVLGRYRVTAREESAEWSETAVDPEMLGRAFESLMASDERRESGAFYTPREIITRVTGEALRVLGEAEGLVGEALVTCASGSRPPAGEGARLREFVGRLRVLDPACGSGAFLVHLLERLADVLAGAGDERPAGERRRDVLTTSIFGVDVNPTAVWLCELRLWLSVVMDTPEGDVLSLAPLPNLDRHIRVGDALAGPAFDEWTRIGGVSQLRARYARATGVRKRTLARALDREERRLAVAVAEREAAVLAARRCDLLTAVRSRDLFAQRVVATGVQQRELDELRHAARDARRRLAALRSGGALPFSFPAHFADVAARGGFDLVIGNPPWVRLHRIPTALRDDLERRYRTFRHAAWLPGAEATGAGRGFAAQVDLAALFGERALQLVREGGTVALLLPAKLWRSLAGGGLRRLTLELAVPRTLEDWSESRSAFDAVVYPSLLVARKRTWTDDPGAAGSSPRPTGAAVRAALHRRSNALEWEQPLESLALDPSPGAPWLVLPPEVRAGFDRLSAAGIPLARAATGRPLLGTKCGCNEAFIVTPRPGWCASDDHAWPVRANGRDGEIERALLRPLLRGEHVRAWSSVDAGDAILWTHDDGGEPLRRLPPLAAEWLAPWRRRLAARADARSSERWWALFRTDAANCERPRVVWSDISRVPRALVLPAGDPTVPLNSCYVARASNDDEALAIAALLNSPVAAAWLGVLAEPARGGYRRYLGWTLARFPLPRDWPRAVKLLAPAGHAALSGDAPAPTALLTLAARAYHLRPADLAPLLTWSLR
jgi:hypothetical protein